MHLGVQLSHQSGAVAGEGESRVGQRSRSRNAARLTALGSGPLGTGVPDITGEGISVMSSGATMQIDNPARG
jgi:hypothetical protein